MAQKRLTDAEYAQLDDFLQLDEGQFYAVVTTKLRTRWVRSIHVFAREPMPQELKEYEKMVSNVKFRGNRTEVEGSQLGAASVLYNKLVLRAYDVPYLNRQVLGEIKNGSNGFTGIGIDAEMARTKVSPMIKRAALRDALGEHYSEAQIAEDEGGEDEVKNKEGD